MKEVDQTTPPRHVRLAKSRLQHAKPKSAYEKMLTEQMQCFRCDFVTGSVPDMKSHLQEHFEKLKGDSSVKKLHDRSASKRSASEEDEGESDDGEPSKPTKRSKLGEKIAETASARSASDGKP